MNRNKEKNIRKEELEDKEGKIKRNEWRKLISVLVALITLYVLNVYNVFDYTGVVLGMLLIVLWGVLINYLVNKIFSLFIN